MNNLPTLYVRVKTGKINQWSVWSEKDYMITEWGQINGKLQQSRKQSYPTNVGKSNERNGIEQAAFDAGSLWRQKKDEGYSESPETAQEATIFLPMLAHELKDTKKLNGKSFDLQPKLDGVRCLAYWEDDKVLLMSRGGKSYSVPHIQKELEQLLPVGTILDGEIWREGLSCQTVTSYVKKTKPGTETLIYNVFDLPSANATWEIRRDDLNNLFESFGFIDPLEKLNHIRLIGAIEGKIENIDNLHDEWVTEGYEGAIIRFHEGLYEWGERSRSLLKYKKFKDSEFKVISIRAGEGKLSKAAVLTCQNDLTSATFDCIFSGTLEQREEQLTNKNKYINQLVTIRYFDRTDDNIPRFPVAKVFRDSKDL